MQLKTVNPDADNTPPSGGSIVFSGFGPGDPDWDCSHRGLGGRAWRGFTNLEGANGHIQIFKELFPLGEFFTYQFLNGRNGPGPVLHVTILKTHQESLQRNSLYSAGRSKHPP